MFSVFTVDFNFGFTKYNFFLIFSFIHTLVHPNSFLRSRMHEWKREEKNPSFFHFVLFSCTLIRLLLLLLFKSSRCHFNIFTISQKTFIVLFKVLCHYHHHHLYSVYTFSIFIYFSSLLLFICLWNSTIARVWSFTCTQSKWLNCTIANIFFFLLFFYSFFSCFSLILIICHFSDFLNFVFIHTHPCIRFIHRYSRRNHFSDNFSIHTAFSCSFIHPSKKRKTYT